MDFAGGSIVPAKSEHAVQAAVFVCELAAKASAEAVGRVIKHFEAAPELHELFPRKIENKPFSLKVGPSGVGVGAASEGVIFDRVAPDGSVELAFALQDHLLSFTCNRYTRWSVVSQEAIDLLMKFVGFFVPAPGISVFGLQYVDEFFVTGDRRAFRPSILFSERGGLLPSMLLNQPGKWHNHSGWYEKTEDSEGRVLNNLNVNLIAQPECELSRNTEQV